MDVTSGQTSNCSEKLFADAQAHLLVFVVSCRFSIVHTCKEHTGCL